MFEQSFVENSASVRKPWSLAASFAGQMIVLVAVVLIPILNTTAITFQLPQPIYVLQSKRPPVPEQKTSPERPAARTTAVRPVFVQPSALQAPPRIPPAIAMIDEPPAPPALVSGVPNGAGSPDGFLNSGLGQPIPIAPPRPQPEKPKPPHRVPVSSGVQAAKITYQPKPVYPPLARAARMQGVVRLQAIIAPDGRIRNLQVVSGPALLVQAAMDAVQQWVYQPTLLNGQAVEVVTQIDVNFTLGN